MIQKINVKGMHCKSCEAIITESIGELPGVKKAKADSAKGEVNVEYEESKISLDKIKETIIKEGYRA